MAIYGCGNLNTITIIIAFIILILMIIQGCKKMAGNHSCSTKSMSFIFLLASWNIDPIFIKMLQIFMVQVKYLLTWIRWDGK